MRISEVERPQTPADVPKEVFDLAKKDKFFQLGIDIMSAGRNLPDKRKAGEDVMSDADYEAVVMETMRRLGAKHDLDPFVCYLVCHELEWQRFRKGGIDKDVQAIDALIDQGDYAAARKHISDARTRWKSKVFNKLSSKINSLDPKR